MGVLVKNGKSYTGTGDLLIQPVIYSDDERCIGVWRDGKPLYQKSFTKKVTNFNTSEHFSMNIQNIDTIPSMVATYNRSTGDTSMLNIDLSWCGLSSTDIWYNINSSLGNGTLIVTIQYTKTTDTAGTAAWVPTGATPIHYSLNEQVIGTWIDGKPLYQKSFEYNNLNTSNVDINVSSLNLKRLVSAELSSINQDGNMVGDSYYENTTDKLTCYYRSDVASIRVRRGNEHAISSQGVLTIKYTKTTD